VQLTPRRRAFIAVVVAWPLGLVYLYLAAHLIRALAASTRGVVLGCGDGALLYVDEFNGCDGSSFHAAYVWLELGVSTVVAVVAAYGLARWVTLPIRGIAETVGRFGPNSLGLRLRTKGPRDETRQLSDAIDAMLDRLAEGYEAQRRFASTASHELRTPLATQRALIEVSLASALTPEQLDLLSRQLLATNERNEHLVDGLLTLAETDRGLLANGQQRLDLIVAEATESLRSAAQERGVQVTCSLAPLTVLGERPLLERLASNLVFNAIRHNHDGGSVAVEVFGDGAFVVTNTGPVVAPEQVAGLFEPFRRGSGERLDHGGGVGLGLTIARSIAAAHGAEIRATANPSGGLRVEVRFRLPG
jgi:signal transduction histidine kinase